MKNFLDYLKAFLFIWVPTILLGCFLTFCNNENCEGEYCDDEQNGYVWNGQPAKDSGYIDFGKNTSVGHGDRETGNLQFKHEGGEWYSIDTKQLAKK